MQFILLSTFKQYIQFSRQLSMQQSCHEVQISSVKKKYENKENRYQPLILSGCSGVGKGTLVKYLLGTYPQLFELCVGYTTRQPRAGEQNGRQYLFVTKQEFENQIKKDVFIQYCLVHGNYYGTHEDRLNQIILKGKICILEIDLQGAQKIYAKRPSSKFLFIQPPSIEELQHRLRTRGTENEENIVKRMKNSRQELEQIKTLNFYQHLVNNDLQVTKTQLVSYLNKIYSLQLAS